MANSTVSKQDLALLKLRYVDDSKPGIVRARRGKGFCYYDTKEDLIKDPVEIKRISKIGVPPAYKNVWICPYPNGHIQATGYDAKGRKQYRYHPDWRVLRDETKFQHVIAFGEALSKIRARINHDLSLRGLPREKVLAAVVRLLEITLIRVGNSQYAKENKSYGLTTLLNKHVDVNGSKLTFQFMGKSGKLWNLSINDRRVAAITKRCADLAGHELYKYIDDDGQQRDVDSSDVNAYLKEITGEDYTAKDFRTWAGTVLAALALKEFEKFETATAAKKNIVKAIESVSKQLGNTPSICRKCYIHPEVLNAYMDDALQDLIEAKINEKIRADLEHLSEEELIVLAFLKKRLK